MNKNEIARIANVSDPFARLILDGKRNPLTKKGMLVLNFAAEIYAEECRIEYIKQIVRTYTLNKTLKKRKKDGEEKRRK